MSSAPRRRDQPSPWRGSLRLGLVLAALVAVNVYIFHYSKTSIRNLIAITNQAAAIPPVKPGAVAAGGSSTGPGIGQPGQAPLAGQAGQAGQAAQASASAQKKLPGHEAEVEVSDEGRIASGTVGASDTLSAVLRREGIPAPTLGEIIRVFGRAYDPKLVRAGQSYLLRFDGEDQLRALEYRTNPATLFRVERGKPGSGHESEWRASKESAALEVRVAEVGGVIESSLYEAVKRTGESPSLVAFFVDMFAWDINFFIDTQSGDRFKLVVEKLYLGDRFYKYGRVLAAEYAGRVGTYRAIWFEPPHGKGAAAGGDDSGGYYDESGQSIVKSLLKTPLKYVRISSSFDRHRFHPVLHTERAHLGVDYAAPTGTPVWATASGRVSFRGPRGGAGNCVMVSHPGGMESIYMHLSKFARGLAVGQSVRQKQVIGYVGMTGLATGPHLHFSLKMGGHFVDPLKLKAARKPALPSSLRAAFAAAAAPRLEALARIDVRAGRPEVARGPSPAP